MNADQNRMPPGLAKLGCLLVFLLVGASVFLGGMVLSKSGIGIVGSANEVTKSPVGVWQHPQGARIEFRDDGTGRSINGGSVSYFEWRLKGNDLALFQFANPNSVGSHFNRVLRGLGIQGERGSDNFELVDVTRENLTLAVDDLPRAPESGASIQLIAVEEETVVNADSAQNDKRPH